MKISQIFDLKKSQYELDFVDVDIEKDNHLFLDPFFISTRPDPWSTNANRTIKSFFQYAIDLIKSGQIDEAKSIFTNLNEPNETCLGMSKAKPRGNGMGPENSEQVFDSLMKSKAVETGVVENLEDTAIFIDGIGKDKVSDATTNIIRKCLLEYTEKQCELWGIPLTPEVPSGFYWDIDQRNWNQAFCKRLIIDEKSYILVPKQSVTFYKDYVGQQYHQHYVLNFLQGEHLQKGSSLVRIRTLKNGNTERYVTKNDIKDKEAPFSKELLRNFTRSHPDIFGNFQRDKALKVKPIANEQISEISLEEVVKILTDSLLATNPGNTDASKYHKLMVGISELIFFPHLSHPIREREINSGRKRIDFTMDNSAISGFFHRLHDVHKIPAGYALIECKNYARDIENPELDQLSGRMTVNSRMFGMLFCRSIANIDLIKDRCRDYWKQKRELILVITDDDVLKWLENIVINPGTILDDLEAKQREIIVS